jgi:hypothetical protein
MATWMPPEVLEIVFQSLLVRRTTDTSVSPTVVLRVCRQWNEIGARILWRDISLRNVDVLSRFSTTAPSPNLLLVKTITIASSPQKTRRFGRPDSILLLPKINEDESVTREHGNIASRSFNQHLDSLSTLLPRMKHLTSFSLQIGPPRYARRERDFIVRRTVLRNLVSSLPSSLRYLELDTRCHERLTHKDRQPHVCHAIAERLTHLHSLRLRLRRVCSDLFCPSESIKSLVINMIENNNTT